MSELRLLDDRDFARSRAPANVGDALASVFSLGGTDLTDAALRASGVGGLPGVGGGITGRGLTKVFQKPTGAANRAATNADQALADAALEILNASRGTRKGYFDQLAQVLHGQIPDARIPDIQFAAESNLRRGSDERRATESTLATAGLARTPLGVSTRAGVGAAADMRASTTAADFLNSLFLQAPNAILGQAQQTGMTGLNTVADIGAQIAAQRAAAQGQAIGGLAAGAGQLAGLAIQPNTGFATPTQTPAWMQWSPP